MSDIEINFSAGAKVVAHYTGNNDDVKTYFSPFACGNDSIIDGLVLDCTNLRYGIHPDFRDARDFNSLTIKNCDLRCYRSFDSSIDNNCAIGAGFPLHGSWNIENCVFRSDTSNRVLRIHNNANVGAKSIVTIKNCYIEGNGHIEVNSYGSSTEKSISIITGCSWINPATTSRETESSNDNIEFLSFNNETRSQI